MATKKKIVTDNKNKLALSVLVIGFYFIWPQIVGIVKSLFSNASDLIFNIISNLVLITVLIYIYRKDLKEYIIKFKKDCKKNILTIIVYSLISIVVVGILNALVTQIFKLNNGTINDGLLLKDFAKNPFLIGLITIFYYPIVEEIVFEKTLKDVIPNKCLFIILSGIFFWYYNVAYTANFTLAAIIGSFYYFVMGVIRAYTFTETDNLLVPIFIKAIYNVFVTFVSVGVLMF